jgi:hypothetical protein
VILVGLQSVGGYPKMSTFGAVVGERSADGRDEFVKYYDAAIEVPSAAIFRMETISRDTGVFLVVGVIERDNGTLYCTVVFIAPEGYITKHRKLMPTGTERLIWGQGEVPEPHVGVGSMLSLVQVMAVQSQYWTVFSMPTVRYRLNYPPQFAGRRSVASDPTGADWLIFYSPGRTICRSVCTRCFPACSS